MPILLHVTFKETPLVNLGHSHKQNPNQTHLPGRKQHVSYSHVQEMRLSQLARWLAGWLVCWLIDWFPECFLLGLLAGRLAVKREPFPHRLLHGRRAQWAPAGWLRKSPRAYDSNRLPSPKRETGMKPTTLGGATSGTRCNLNQTLKGGSA